MQKGSDMVNCKTVMLNGPGCKCIWLCLFYMNSF